MLMWSNEKIEQWRLAYSTYLSDMPSVTFNRNIDRRRPHTQQEMTQLLRSFLDGAITLKEFNTVFQQKTHNAWNVFHLQGMSGGLFLNKLVKHVPSEDTFGHLFRLMMRVPEETQDGQRQMQAFVQFLEGLIASRQVTRAQLQPARVPFFLSAWWHIQDPERWPIFYLDVRQALLTEETHPKEAQNPVETYFSFRTRFLALAQALGVSIWELEHLASWYARRDTKSSDVGNKRAYSDVRSDSHGISARRETCVLSNRAGAKNENESAVTGGESSAHMKEPMVSCRTHLQWLLAKLGHKVGCRVWIAASDHSKECQRERLGDLSLPTLPVLADTPVQQIIRQIDVLWLLDNDIIAAYEIEQAHTDVSTSLLRLYDLDALLPTREVHLCIVAPSDRFEKIRFELSRPTFRDLAPRKNCALISEELLLQQETHILRWASSPAVVEELICRAGDGEQ